MMCADQIFNRVLEFVAANISHQNWKHRQASLRAFCTLLEGSDTHKMQSATVKALVEFIRLLDDNSEDVQFNAAFCLNKIAEFFPECFVQHQQFSEILDMISSKLQRSVRVSIELCNIFT
jgi:importin subunit beta-1